MQKLSSFDSLLLFVFSEQTQKNGVKTFQMNRISYNSSIRFILKEVKFRLAWITFCFFLATGTCYWFSEEFFFGLTIPFLKVASTGFFICTQITESLTTYILISTVLGFYSCIPYFFYQLWCFFIPSRYQNQRRAILQTLIFTFFIFFLAVICTFHWILPNIWFFLYQLSNTEPESQMFVIKLQPKIYDFSLLTLQIISIMILCSQIPLILMYSIQKKIICRKRALKSRHSYIFISILFAALITPPDIWCQLSVWFFVLIFIELALLLSIVQNQYSNRNRNSL